jgi:sugar phosphate permease
VTSDFQKINMKKYHWNKKNYIDLNTLFYLDYGLSHLPSGIVSDNYGAKHVIEASLLFMALASMFTPFLIVQTEGSPTVVTIIRFFSGLCEGTLMPGAVSMKRKSNLNSHRQLWLEYSAFFLTVAIGNCMVKLVKFVYRYFETTF